MRIAPALRQLVTEIQLAHEGATVEYDEPDGLGVVRSATIALTKIDKPLTVALQAVLATDRRVISVEWPRPKVRRVTVSAGSAADFAESFGIAPAVTVAVEQPEAEADES